MYRNTKLNDYMVLRRRAIELFENGKPQKYIVEALGVSQPSVSRWISSYRELGPAFFERPKVGGSRRFLTPQQMEELLSLLDAGAEASGFKGNLWDRKRVKALIEKEFGITYKIRSISDLLKDLGYTLQPPDRRSYRQDPEKVREWQEEKLPALKKSVR